MSVTLPDLLREAVVTGSPQALDALVARGADAVACFHDVVTGKGAVSLPAGRDTSDGLSHVAHVLGQRLPREFFDVFRSETHTYALIGLGATGLPEAQPVLVKALGRRGHWTSRIHAAMGLRYLPGPAAVEALLKATRSRQYLIRYHAVDSLAVIGDESALPRLRQLAHQRRDRGVSGRALRALELLERRGSS